MQGSNRITKPTRTGSTKLDSGLTSPKAKQSSPIAKQTSPIPKPRILSDRSPKTVDAKSAIKRNNNTSVRMFLFQLVGTISVSSKFWANSFRSELIFCIRNHRKLIR